VIAKFRGAKFAGRLIGAAGHPLSATRDIPNRGSRQRPSKLTMALALAAVSISTRRKLTSILLSVTIFALLAGLTTLAIGRPVIFGILHAIFVGTGVGFFEEFYVQSPRGRWLRSMHPVRSIFLYTIVVLILYVISICRMLFCGDLKTW
jgi:hypothetical protein